MHDSPPVPTASGSLAKTPLAHLLVYALERRLTGTFELSLDGASVATMLMSGGCPSKVRTTEPIALLGVVLEELGLITAAQLESSRSRMQEAARLQGEILLEMGALDAPGLEAGLRAQLERKLEHLFDLSDEASFAYYDGADPLARFGGAPAPIDPFPVLWRGVRQSPRWDHVEATLRRVGAARLRLAPAANPDRFGFGQEEREAVAALAQRPMRLVDITNALGSSVGQLLAYVLVITKQVVLIDGSARASTAPSSGPAETPRSLASPATGQAFARVQLQKQPSTRGPLVVEEHVTASASDARASYPEIATRKPGAPFAAATAPAGAPEVASQGASLTPEESALRAKILETAERISSQNYFEMLGLPRDAPMELVQRAFLDLAKVWHPDRLPTALSDVKDACSKVFSHLTQAHATLTDAAKRQEYATLLRDGGATPEDQTKIAEIVEAATEFQKAEFLLKRNLADPKAYEIVKRCVALDPEQADYLATLAWLDAHKPEGASREKVLEQIAVLDRALQMNAGCERAYYYRGMLYKRADEPSKAVRDFEKAAELNPRNLDAMREIRLYNMRTGASRPPPSSGSGRSKAPTEPRGGLFGRLFKK